MAGSKRVYTYQPTTTLKSTRSFGKHKARKIIRRGKNPFFPLPRRRLIAASNFTRCTLALTKQTHPAAARDIKKGRGCECQDGKVIRGTTIRLFINVRAAK